MNTNKTTLLKKLKYYRYKVAEIERKLALIDFEKKIDMPITKSPEIDDRSLEGWTRIILGQNK